MIECTLGWPPQELNPNKKSHWAVKAKAAKSYRRACSWIVVCATRQQQEGFLEIVKHKYFERNKFDVSVTFYPPDRRKRDQDNCIASFKSGQDGISDALKINDRDFVMHYEFSDEIGGMIKVKIAPHQ